jgi:hypothetical protein
MLALHRPARPRREGQGGRVRTDVPWKRRFDSRADRIDDCSLFLQHQRIQGAPREHPDGSSISRPPAIISIGAGDALTDIVTVDAASEQWSVGTFTPIS